jgi:hypothetical protein
MIEMSCPRCGAGGRVPSDRVNSRLVCKKCLSVFHLNSSLKAVMGEPAPPKEAAKERAPRERTELGLGLELGGLGERLGKLKLPDPKTVGVVAGVLLAIGFFWWLFSKQSVEKRTQAMASAIKTLDMDTTVSLSMPGTELDAMKWLGDTHKQYTDLKLAIGNIEPGIQISVQPTSDGSSAQALLIFSREGATSTGPLSVEEAASLEPKSSEKKKSMELVLFWTKDTWQAWRLDGKQTMEKAAASTSN